LVRPYVAALITGGAVADYETVDGVTALVTAVRFNRAGAAALLVERGADVNKEDTVKGVTPLKVAVVGRCRLNP